MTRELLHYGLHLGLPLLAAFLVYRDKFWRAFFWMLAGWSIDIDHLLTDPIYDPMRCSPGFHMLHSLPALGIYYILAVYPKTRWFGLGLVMHLIADAFDCWAITGLSG